MNQVECKECNELISEKALICPHCGVMVNEGLLISIIQKAMSDTNLDSTLSKKPVNVVEKTNSIEAVKESKNIVDEPKIDWELDITEKNLMSMMAKKMILAMRQVDQTNMTLCEIAALPFNNFDGFYFYGLETVSRMIMVLRNRKLIQENMDVEPASIATWHENQLEFMKELNECYVKRNGRKPQIEYEVGIKYSLTDIGRALNENILEQWINTEFSAKAISLSEWEEKYFDYMVRNDIYNPILDDMYFSSDVFVNIRLEELLFYNKNEKDVQNLEAKRYEIMRDRANIENQRAMIKSINDLSKSVDRNTMVTARIATLNSYSNYSYLPAPSPNASVIGRGIAGAIIAGPAGAVVGALSAVDKNRR